MLHAAALSENFLNLDEVCMYRSLQIIYFQA